MSNRKIILLTLFIIAGMIIFPTIYKVYKEHNDNLILVVEKEFSYYAKKCFNEDKCENEIIYLKDLYENKIISFEVYDRMQELLIKKMDKIILETKTKN